MTRISLLASFFMIITSICSCRSPAPAAESPQTGPIAEQATATTTGSRFVSSVLFLDLTDPCKCTKARQEKTWAKLQQAVKDMDIEVERVHWDGENERAEALAEKEPFSVIPALYFLDGEDGIVDMVQGEVSLTQLEKILGGPGGSSPCSPGQGCPGD